MEKGFDYSWSQDQQTDWLSVSSARFGLGPQVMFPSFGNMVSPPVCHEPSGSGWFYGLPRYHDQGFIPMVNSTVKQVEENLKLPEASLNVAQEVQKKFLVFDQSGDQTTVMYSLGVGPSSTRYQFPCLNEPKPQFGSHTICVDKVVIENDGNDSESEMREDTEELNALLYSDDYDYDSDSDNDDDDDETSTGHSPSSKMGFHEQKRKIEEEEVASSGGPLKRHKKEDTASSGQSGINCCRNEGDGVFEEEYDNVSCGSMKSRKEKIKETLNVVKNLIPGDKNGKSVIMVIDEAINYLTSLKVKA